MVIVNGNQAEFSFFRPAARQVPMIRRSDGHWQAKLSLPPGTFKFRYCADGEWFTDYAAFGIEFGPFGPDSLLRVADNLTAR